MPLLALLPLWAVGCYVVYFVAATYPARHWIGADAHAYWVTAHRPVLYAVRPGGVDAYNYSPAFAQAIHPLAALPWPVFLTAWMALESVAFAWLLAPMGWRWAIPFWLCCSVAIAFGNVWPFLAVVAVLGRRHPSAWTFSVLTKLTPGVGLLWHVARREWNRLGVALLAILITSAISVAIDPSAWRDWVHFLARSSGDGSEVGLRVVLAGILVVWAARSPRRSWLLSVAVILSCPILAGWQWITVLAAIPRLAARPSDAVARAPRPISDTSLQSVV